MKFHVIDLVTGQRVDTEKIALAEDWACGLLHCDMEGFAIQEDGCLVLMDECGSVRYCPPGRFQVVLEMDEPCAMVWTNVHLGT